MPVLPSGDEPIGRFRSVREKTGAIREKTGTERGERK